MRVDVCSACHPFYTGKQKILDTGGRVARFQKRYAASEAGRRLSSTERRERGRRPRSRRSYVRSV